MISPTTADRGLSLTLIEGGLTLIAVALAFCLPRLGNSFFSKIERCFRRLARKKGLAVAVVGVAVVLLRLAILPVCPIPHFHTPDDFSFLLAANTFASGRLTNPTPAMWVHFETIHITMTPTYMSMYFPGQGLAMAAGKTLLGNPWFGILLSSALMCAALCWALQAWLPPTWALLGGVIAVLRIGLFSYWTNSYTGGGSLAALGGALVLGSLPRFLRRPRLGYSIPMAIGAVLLALSRPYEGILLCLPVAVVLGRRIFWGDNRPPGRELLRLAAAPMAILVAAGAWYAYYDYRVFGNPLTPPYQVDRAEYAMAPYFVWQKQRPQPAYRHAMMREFYYQDELIAFRKIHNPAGFVPQTLFKAARALLFYAGILLLVPLIMLRRVLLDRRIRFLVLCIAVLMAGQLIENFLIAHYIAPFTVAFYAIGLQAMRHLRLRKWGGQPVGLALVRFVVTLCFVLGGARLFAEPLHIALPVWPAAWAANWYGSAPAGDERARVESALERMPGKQLALVHYSADHSPLIEWIFNGPDLDNSKVIWAWDMGPAKNRELLQYYKDRHAWLVEPDVQPAAVSPYVLSAQPTAAAAVDQAMAAEPASQPDKESQP